MYRANQVTGSVILIAYGKHPVEGFEVWFQDTPIAVFPPEYELRHRPPEDGSAQVETEFVAWTSFPAEEEVESVTVHDADGRQTVKVEQTPDFANLCESSGGYKKS